MVENIGRTGRTNVGDMIRDWDRYPSGRGRVEMPQIGRRRRGMGNRIRQFGRGMVGGDAPVATELAPMSNQNIGKEGAIVKAVGLTLQTIENYRAAQAAAEIARQEGDREAEKHAMEMAQASQSILEGLLDRVEDHPDAVTAIARNMAEKGPEGLRDIASELSTYDFKKENEMRGERDIDLAGKMSEATSKGTERVKDYGWDEAGGRDRFREKEEIKSSFQKPPKTDEEKIQFEIDKKKRMVKEELAETPAQINERKRLEREEKKYDRGLETTDKEFDRKVEKGMLDSELATMNKKYEDYGIIIVKDARGEPWKVENTADLWGLAEGLSEKEYTDYLHQLKTAQQKKKKKWKGIDSSTPKIEETTPVKPEVDDPLELLK